MIMISHFHMIEKIDQNMLKMYKVHTYPNF